MASLVMELDQRTTSSCAILFDHEYRIKSFAQFDQIRFLPCMAKNTYGTGFFMLLNTGEAASPSEDGLLTTVGWKFGIFLLKGSVFIAGATVQWQRNGLGIINNSSDVETLAKFLWRRRLSGLARPIGIHMPGAP
jgi:glycerol kinase